MWCGVVWVGVNRVAERGKAMGVCVEKHVPNASLCVSTVKGEYTNPFLIGFFVSFLNVG